MPDLSHRRDALLASLRGEGIDALLVSEVHNVTWLTGFSGDSSVVVLTPSRMILVSDKRYVGQIADECPEIETFIRPPTQPIHAATAEVLTKLGVRRVGVEAAGLTLADAQALRDAAPVIDWKVGGDRVEALRQVKDACEVSAIREAIAIAERAYAVFCATMRADHTEKYLADEIEHLVRREGGLTCSFPPIIGVGRRAALPHCPPTAQRIDAADFVLTDWGAVGPTGYRSDLTRVIPTHKKGSTVGDRLREVYNVVRRANEAAIAAVRPGAVARDIDAAARGVIEAAGYGDCFGHGLGHGIGLKTHEAPSIRQTSDTVVVPGMVFTIEPGVYLPEWGGVRIEDDVLVTADGCEVLTSVSKDLDSLWRDVHG